MIFVLAIAVGYLIGSINPAAIIARLRGVDYRSVGSGNPGATNVKRSIAAMVFSLTALDGCAAVSQRSAAGFQSEWETQFK